MPIGEFEDAPFTIELSPTPPSRESLSPRLLNMSLGQEEAPAHDSSAHEKLSVTVPMPVPIPGLVDSELSPADVPRQVGRLQTLVSKSSAKITALSHRVGGVEQQLLEQHRLIERLEATQVDAIVELHAIREMVNQTNSRMRYMSEDMRIVKAQSIGDRQMDTFESVLRKQSQALESVRAGVSFDANAPGSGPASDATDSMAMCVDAGGSAYRPNRVPSLVDADSSAVRDLESKVSGLRLDVFAWQSEQQSEQARLADELRGTIGSLANMQRAQREQAESLLAEVRELTRNVRGEMDEIRTEMGTIRESVLIIEQREPISKEVCVMAQNLVAGPPHTKD